MQKLSVRDFDLGLTLESGQFFRYKKFAGMYYVNSADKVFVVGQNEGKLIYDGVDKKFISNFFGLNDDYSGIVKAISKDSVMKKLTAKYPGLRLIRQDPWECMMSYVCSSASNIPKIQKNVNLLSQSFGSPVRVAGYASHSFPEVGDIDHLPTIKECKTGFRANYIYELNKMITPTQVAHLQNMDYGEAVNVLTQLPGIGPKVADCIALFSLGHTNAFPVDTHIRQVMRHCYPQLKNVADSEIKSFAQDHFDPYAGYAELFLFEYGRKELNKN
ncbi:MAG: DNA glycosylase [Candidatus Woesearchaeota archaeon]